MRTVLRKGETLKIMVRRHWIVFTGPALALVGAVVFLYIVQIKQWTQVMDIALWSSIGALSWAVYAYFDWKTNVWAVTSERVIDEWGIISRNAKESPLDRINNVSYTQSIPGRILGFGDVEIQTAASEGATVNRMVSYPKLLQETIMAVKSEYGKTPVDKGTIPKDEKECQWCAERIRTKAKVCKYCGKEVAASDDQQVVEHNKLPPDEKSLPAEKTENVKWARFK